MAAATARTDHPVQPRRRPVRSAIGLLLGSKEGAIGLAILLLFALVVLLGPSVAPYSPTETGVGVPDQGPSGEHLLGTDSLGRDVLSRLLNGAGSVIWIPLLATALAFALGGTLGLVAGYRGGSVDWRIATGINVLLAMPPLLVVLVIITTAGSSAPVLVLTVGIVYSPRVARILRGATQGIAHSEYIQAAQARGERTLPIVLREVLPNITATAFVEFAVRLTYVIIFIATLNFLGLGSQPPSPNWGLMVAEGQLTIVTNPVTTMAPALAIAVLSVGVSLVADAVTQSTRVVGADEYVR